MQYSEYPSKRIFKYIFLWLKVFKNNIKYIIIEKFNKL